MNGYIYLVWKFTETGKQDKCTTPPTKKSSPIDRLKRTLSFGYKNKEELGTSLSKNGKKKDTKVNKSMQCEDDEKTVRNGMISFNVKVRWKSFIRIFNTKKMMF